MLASPKCLYSSLQFKFNLISTSHALSKLMRKHGVNSWVSFHKILNKLLQTIKCFTAREGWIEEKIQRYVFLKKTIERYCSRTVKIYSKQFYPQATWREKFKKHPMVDWISKTSVDWGQLYAPDATQDVAINFLIHFQEFDGKNKTISTRRNSRQLTAYTFCQKQNSWFIYRFKYSFHFRQWNKTLGAKIQKVHFDCAFLNAYSCSDNRTAQS